MYGGDGRKKNKQKTEKRNQGKDFPRLVDLPSHRLRNGGRLFSGVRIQAGPTLVGRGILA